MTALLLLGLVLAIWLLDLAQSSVRARWQRRRAGDYSRALGGLRAITGTRTDQAR